jgi:phosphoglucosamine mutase
MSRKYFGTDGVRGTVGSSPMTPDFVLRLGYAAGKMLSGRVKNPVVLIGKDTRISGYMLESALRQVSPRRGSTCTCAARFRRPPWPDARAAALGGVVISASRTIPTRQRHQIFRRRLSSFRTRPSC